MKNIVEVSDLFLKRNNKILFNSISFALESGKLYFFRGANGAGKSTLFELIAGNLRDINIEELQGRIGFLGYKYSLKNISEIRDKICFVPQNVSFDEHITVKEFFSIPFDYNIVKLPNNIKLFDYLINFIKENHLDFAIECKDSKDLLKKRISRMSLGQQHIISIYGNLIGREQSCFLFLFDEPLNYLDYNNSILVLNKINQIHLQNKNAAIVACSHCQSLQNVDIAYEIKGTMLNKIQYNSFSCFGLAEENGIIKINYENK